MQVKMQGQFSQEYKEGQTACSCVLALPMYILAPFSPEVKFFIAEIIHSFCVFNLIFHF
jgi:hypothetical protein